MLTPTTAVRYNVPLELTIVSASARRHSSTARPHDPGFPGRWIAFLLAALVLSAPAWAQDDSDCLACHGEPDLFEGLENAAALVLTEAAHANSMHGSAGLGCVDCHQDLVGFDGVHDEELQPAACSGCHGDVQEDFDASVHGYAHQRGNPRAPGCASCHGAHDILPSSDPLSRTHGVRLFTLCVNCHGDAALTGDPFVKRIQNSAGYDKSVHSRVDPTGKVAASCVDCHGVHRLRGAADPESGINRARVATTCGGCHQDILGEYSRSIHGLALDAGISDAPTCTDCHGEHLIQATNDSGGITTAQLAAETCADCHNDPRLIAKYSLDGVVVDSYNDSYHGWATLRNSERAANCVSCHTAHAVLPKKHPESTVHPARVVGTCQTCHPRADASFAASYTHLSASLTGNPINRAIRNIYRVMIALVIGGMAVHNLIIVAYFARRRRRAIEDSGWVQRFTGGEIVQHLVLAISFILLVITGFALRFPEAWWVGYLGAVGMTEPVRANLHRVCAVVLVVVSIYHVYYLAFTRRGRAAFRDMLPARSDLKDIGDNMRYHTGRTGRHPRFGRFDYTEKAEYWALIWGTGLMAVTGVVLWFPELAVKVLPSWVVPASQTIHYYEAWLATLAILVWHFFFVIFHPDAYPLSWTMVTGKMSEETVQTHHPQWYDAHAAAGMKAVEANREAVPSKTDTTDV